MAKKCSITGKKPMTGSVVSHSNKKSKKRSVPNLQNRRIWVPSIGRFAVMKVSARALRTMDKVGVDAALKYKMKHERT